MDPSQPSLRIRRWSLSSSRAGRAWSWLLDIRHPDPAYSVLLRGFTIILVALLAPSILYVLADYVIDVPSSKLVGVLVVIILAALAGVRAGGGRAVPMLFAVMVALVVSVLYRPDSYITPDGDIMIQAGLLPAALLATLFVHPAAGIPIIALTLGGLGYRAWAAGVPPYDVARFLSAGALNLVTTTMIAAVVASMLTRAIRQATDLAANLERRVAQRTEELEQRAAQILVANQALERRTADLEQRSAQLLAARNALGRTMRQTAHDLGNLLMARLGELARVEKAARAGDFPGVLTALEGVEASTLTLGGLLSDLRESGVAVDGELRLGPEQVALDQLSRKVGEELSIQMGRRKIAYSVEVAPGVAPAWCDPERILRVLLNVVGNAVKYIGGGSRITVCITADDRWVYWRCEDDGKGMAPHELDRIGQEFYRVIHENGDPGGSGIGLHYCGVILRLSGGDITYASDGPGRGTRVTITLPRGAGGG